MAITTVNAVYSGTGPAKSGQILANANPGPGSRALEGICTATGDGASATFDCNFIDGTEVLPFTPLGMFCQRSGGAATSTIGIVSCVATATKFTVVTDANVNAATFIVSFRVFK